MVLLISPQVSCHFYMIAERLERKADKLPAGSAERLAEYRIAQQNYQKAIDAAPMDGATQQAWTRINAKLNPDLIVTELPSGHCQILNLNDRAVHMDVVAGMDPTSYTTRSL